MLNFWVFTLPHIISSMSCWLRSSQETRSASESCLIDLFVKCVLTSLHIDNTSRYQSFYFSPENREFTWLSAMAARSSQGETEPEPLEALDTYVRTYAHALHDHVRAQNCFVSETIIVLQYYIMYVTVAYHRHKQCSRSRLSRFTN